METIASLIREFPFGSFLIIAGTLIGISGIAHALINRNKPVCECECCEVEDDEEECEDDKDDGEP